MSTSTTGTLRGRIGVLFRAATAVLVILGLTAGVPWLLVATVGNPLPSEGWSWDQPLTNDAVLGFLAGLAWLFWAQLTLCLVIEILAEARVAAGRSADWMAEIPGTFAGQQHLARVLVQAVVAVGLGAAVAPGPTNADPTHMAVVGHELPVSEAGPAAASPTTTPVSARSQAPVPARAAEPDQRGTATVEVTKGDTLWSIAERQLGSGEKWRRIADLNAGRLMPDGERFAQATSIQPGWQLLVPTAPDGGITPGPGQVTGKATGEVTVAPGDSLWGLAEEKYGDGEAWPRLYRANQGQIADPDLVFPGQILDVPQRRGPSVERPEPREPEPRDEDRSRGSTVPGPPEQTPPGSPDPTPAPGGAGERTETAPATPEAGSDGTDTTAPADADDGHLRVALIGGGGLLAAGAFAALMARRGRQFRNRRSGRTIAPTPPALVPAEATLRSTGTAGGVAAGFLDRALRDLSYRLAHAAGQLPDIVAVRLADDRLDLILAGKTSRPPPEPWTVDPAGDRWTLARDASIEDSDALAPYPALVAIGNAEEDGATWLLDLEAAGLLHLRGDSVVCQDFARFMGAELALNVWSDDVDVTVAGFAEELVGLNPERLRHRDQPDVNALTKTARRTQEGARAMNCDVLGGRRDGVGGDTWVPTILLTHTVHEPDQLSEDFGRFLDELAAHPGRSAVAAVTTGDLTPLVGATILTVDEDRKVRLPWGQVRLIANQLTATDARTVAGLLEAADEGGDEPMPPAAGTRPFEEVSDAAGALKVELTEPRDEEGAPDSLLPRADQEYLAAGATTTADLATLAPNVPLQKRTIPVDASLDEDLAAWSDPITPRPRLRLLGPVEVYASGERTPEVDRRCAYFIEVVAYLATRDHGATPEQVAEAFHVQTNTIHSRVGTIRKWFGTDPTTGDWYLPESTRSPSAKARGVPVYEVVGLLTDADLFKRLRVRGQARGPDGIEDLVGALRLVVGKPFDQGRPEGYGWLAETPLDQYLTAGVVDVAHIIATHALAAGDVELARWASQTAVAAAPAEDKPRLDLAAVMAAQGHEQQLQEHLATDILNRSDDDQAPPSPSGRTAEVLESRGWTHGKIGS